MTTITTPEPSLPKATSKPSIIFILGAPGAGKGTLCTKLASRKGGYCHISTGDHLRSLRDADADQLPTGALGGLTAAQLRADLKARRLLPAACIVAMLKHKIDQERGVHGSEVCFLIDGFPREVESARVFEEVIAAPEMVLLIDCEKSQAEQRFVSRAREDDDGHEVWRKRYAEYVVNNQPILQRYMGKLRKIDNAGTQEKAFSDLLQLFEESAVEDGVPMEWS